MGPTMPVPQYIISWGNAWWNPGNLQYMSGKDMPG
jgi:hypothetical protein